jgi:hypothetical protein
MQWVKKPFVEACLRPPSRTLLWRSLRILGFPKSVFICTLRSNFVQKSVENYLYLRCPAWCDHFEHPKPLLPYDRKAAETVSLK